MLTVIYFSLLLLSCWVFVSTIVDLFEIHRLVYRGFYFTRVRRLLISVAAISMIYFLAELHWMYIEIPEDVSAFSEYVWASIEGVLLIIAQRFSVLSSSTLRRYKC